jgi:hypothetical protein
VVGLPQWSEQKGDAARMSREIRLARHVGSYIINAYLYVPGRISNTVHNTTLAKIAVAT